MVHGDQGPDMEYDARSNTYRFECGRDDEHTSTAVVKAVATAVGSDPTNIEPLDRTVDPDALDAFFDSPWGNRKRDTDCRLSFQFSGCVVTVDSAGHIVVEPE